MLFHLYWGNVHVVTKTRNYPKRPKMNHNDPQGPTNTHLLWFKKLFIKNERGQYLPDISLLVVSKNFLNGEKKKIKKERKKKKKNKPWPDLNHQQVLSNNCFEGWELLNHSTMLSSKMSSSVNSNNYNTYQRLPPYFLKSGWLVHNFLKEIPSS